MWIVRGNTILIHFRLDIGNGTVLTGLLDNTGHGALVAGEEHDPVFKVVGLNKVQPVRRQFAAVNRTGWFGDHQRNLVHIQRYFVNGRQYQQVLVTVFAVRLEQAVEVFAQLFQAALFVVGFGLTVQFGRQVLNVLKEQTLVTAAVQIPCLGWQVIHNALFHLGDIPPRRTEEADDFVFAQTMGGSRNAGQGGDQNQFGDILGIGIAAQSFIQLFGNGVAIMGDIVNDGFGQRRVDAFDFRLDLIVVQVEIVGVNEFYLIGTASTFAVVIHIRNDGAHQADQATGLLETGVFLEACVQVPDREVERVRLFQLGSVGLWRLVGDVHLLGLFYGLGVFFRYCLDHRLIRHLFKQAGAQDVIQLIALGINRLQWQCGTVGLFGQVVQRFVQCAGTAFIRSIQVGNNHTDVGQVRTVYRHHQVGECSGGYHGQVGVTHFDRLGIVQIRGQLI